METLQIVNVGLQESQVNFPLEYEINYPQGFGHWSLMLFHGPFEVSTPEGIQRRPAFEFLINSPDFPMWHRSTEGAFRNDWVHFDGRAVAELLCDHGIPVDRPFQAPQAVGPVAALIRDIHREKALRDHRWESAATRRILDILVALERSRRWNAEKGFSQSESDHLERFRDLRLNLARSLDRPWTIAQMAELTALSPSRFAALYQRFFGVAPFADLLALRIEYAKVQLANSSITVEAAAHQAGFGDVRHFSRTFRAITGVSPGSWRSPHLSH